MQQGPTPAEQQVLSQIDHVEVPSTILENANVLRNVPAEIKRWGQLKQWVAQNPGQNAPNALETLRNFQRAHYQSLVRARQIQMQQRQQAAGLASGQPMNQPQPPPMVAPPGMQQAPVAPMMGQQPMPNNAGAVNMANLGPMQPISQQDIQRARAHTSGRYAGMSDEDIKNVIIRNQISNRQRMMLAQQQAHQQAQQQAQGQQVTAMQIPQIPAMPQMSAQPGAMQNGMQRPAPGQPQMQPNQTQKQVPRPQQPAVQASSQQQSSPSEPVQPTPPNRGARAGQIARQAAPNASPSQPPKSLKRANSDDVVEVPNPNLQQPRTTPQQQQAPQKPPQRPVLTAAQIAALPPDARAKYEQSVRTQQAVQVTPEDNRRCQAVEQEELSRNEILPVIDMTQDQRTAVANKLMNLIPKLARVRQIVARWFAISHDEKRLRIFYRTVGFHVLNISLNYTNME